MSDVKIIKAFCSDGDPRNLSKLSPASAVLFQKLCLFALKDPKANHEIALKLLRFYQLDNRGRRMNLKKVPRAKAQAQVKKLAVSLTGARAGDVLVGASKGTKGAVMRIYDRDVPPQRRTLDGIRMYPDLWDAFIIKLGALPFFVKMSKTQREIWLEIHEASNENSIGQEGTRLQIIQPGVGDLNQKLSEQQLDNLINGNPYSEDGFWSYKEIENMIERKPGSQARRHTLILIRSFWKVAIDYQVVEEFKGLTVDIERGEVYPKANILGKGEEIFVLGSITREVVRKGRKWVRPLGPRGIQKIGLQVSKRRVDLNLYSHNNLIQFAFRNFTAASYKSLIQKIIRFRAEKVDIGGGSLVPCKDVLEIAMYSLAKHPGAFIPDIQRYVTGMESLAKRLAVIILEDSLVPLEQAPNRILSLLSGSLLCQRVRNWIPSRSLLDSWFQSGFKALSSKKAVEVDLSKNWHKKRPYVLEINQPRLQSASAILDELRSFSTDLGLARGWAQNYPNLKIVTGTSFPKVMPLCHCVDQHWAPGLVHYFDPTFVHRISKGHTAILPFQPLFNLIWDESSRINPRRVTLDWKKFEKKSVVKHIRRAQQLYLVAKQREHKERLKSGGIFTLRYTLDDSWLSGMIGAIEIKANRKLKHPAMLVTLSTDNPLRLIAIRRPSRNMSEEPLSPEAEEMAISIAKTRLKIGISLNKAKAPAPILENCTLVLEEMRYVIRKSDKRKCISIPWDIIKKLSIDLPLLESINDWTIEKALTYTSIGVEKKAKEKLNRLIRATPLKIVRHALIYLSTFGSSIEMNRVSRDGGGTYKAVSIDDVATYQFLLRISSIYPAALSPALFKPSTFTIPVGPLLWTIRQHIVQLTSEGEIGDKGWNNVRFKDEQRILWTHQREMVGDMIKNKKAGNKGNFIWVPVGLGKTLSVLTYLQYLKEHNQLPTYIIYTLPQSAIKSIIQEIRYFDVPINVIIPLKNNKKHAAKYSGVHVSQNCRPKPYTINLIEHDHLRRCDETLLSYASRSFLIVDEVHKTLNDTKRTTIALELAHLSHDFVVLTGTPVIDNDTHKLIGWLKQVVPFEVNSKNFWSAANSMIAKTVNTGVRVDDEDIIAKFTSEEERYYNQLVPPALGGSNTNPTYEDWFEATTICYQACNRRMVKLTLQIIKKKRGVMLVARNAKHQQLLYKILLEKKIEPRDIYILGSGDSIFLTDEAVNEGKIHGYKVVIVPQRKAEGYTLTYLSAMVTSVYPSNNATREQLRGRINRISQRKKSILYRTVHIGLLTSILRNHESAKNLSIALKGLAEKF